MGFWGIEVKPGKPHPYHSDNVQGTLYVTQATLGLGSSAEKSILQCSVGHKSPVFLCTLLPDKIESCSLNLEFKDELVAFSVIGPRSIHISGYFASDEGDDLRDEYESDSGEDIADTETDEDSSEYDYDDEFDAGDFINDDEDGDLEMFPPSPVPNSGVVIEEIMDDDKPTNGNVKSDRSKKKKRSSEHEEHNNSQKQIVAKTNTGVSVLESEDEDGFPILASQKEGKSLETQENRDEKKLKKALKKDKKKEKPEEDHDASEKTKVESTDVDDEPEKKTKKKRRKKKKQKVEEPDAHVMDGDDKKNDNTLVTNTDDKKNSTHVIDQDDMKSDLLKTEVQPEEAMKLVSPESNAQGAVDVDAGNEQGEKSSVKKKRKKKDKTQVSEEGANKEHGVSTSENKAISTLGSEENQSVAKPSNVRSFSNGLVIEDLAIGKPDGKRAFPGSKVFVHYIGKLKKNGYIFDSNVGARAPFKFRLGLGEVIKGWDVGVNGMRIGDKRRLTIPPSMGYGTKPYGKIPPNSWLVFDVELVDVN